MMTMAMRDGGDGEALAAGSRIACKVHTISSRFWAWLDTAELFLAGFLLSTAVSDRIKQVLVRAHLALW